MDFRFNRTRFRKASPENSKSGALSYEALLRHKLVRGEDIFAKPKEPKITEKQQSTFGEFAEKWLDVYVQNNNKFSVVSEKRYALNTHLLPYFGQKLIDQISNLDIEEFKAKKLKSGLMPKTVNNQLTDLSCCLNKALEWSIIDKIPKIRKLKVAPQKYDFLSETESSQLLNNSTGLLHEMILVALKTGVRIGELIALDWSDVDFEEKVLTVRQAMSRGRLGSTKSNKIRHIPLTATTCEMLSKRAKRMGFIFVDKSGNPLKSLYSLRSLQKTCRNAGMRKIGWHTLRHTFASHLAANNVPMRAVQELLGHANIVTTMRYSHVSHATLRDAIKTLEEKKCGHDLGTMLINVPQNIEEFTVKNVGILPETSLNLARTA